MSSMKNTDLPPCIIRQRTNFDNLDIINPSAASHWTNHDPHLSSSDFNWTEICYRHLSARFFLYRLDGLLADAREIAFGSGAINFFFFYIKLMRYFFYELCMIISNYNKSESIKFAELIACFRLRVVFVLGANLNSHAKEDFRTTSLLTGATFDYQIPPLFFRHKFPSHVFLLAAAFVRASPAPRMQPNLAQSPRYRRRRPSLICRGSNIRRVKGNKNKQKHNGRTCVSSNAMQPEYACERDFHAFPNAIGPLD